MFSGLLDLSVWQLVSITLVFTHITIAAVTIFLHRHQAHRALDLHPIPSHFFRLWLWLTTGMNTREWAAIHRKHHAKCETAEDPHSPQIVGINKVLWTGVLLYVKESRNQETLKRYGHGTPADWIEKNIYTPFPWHGIVITAAVDILLFGAIPGILVWATQMLWIPFWAAGVINGIGHFWGYRNFQAEDASTNIFPIGILIGGEELHNNHHAYATSAKLSSKWYEFDIGWLYIRILETLGLATVKKAAPKVKRIPGKEQCDFDTLQAVITHRYDLLARYARTLQATFAQEFGKRHDFGQVKKLLHLDAGQLSAEAREKLDEMLSHSPVLKTLYAMREDLARLWERSAVSREHLLAELEAWCKRAEASGIRELEAFSRLLKSYA